MRKGKQGGDIQGMGIRNMYKGRESEKMRNREALYGWRKKWSESEGMKGS